MRLTSPSRFPYPSYPTRFFLATVKRDIVPREGGRKGEKQIRVILAIPFESLLACSQQERERKSRTPAIFAVEEEEDGKREGEERERKGICSELIEFSAPIV